MCYFHSYRVFYVEFYLLLLLGSKLYPSICLRGYFNLSSSEFGNLTILDKLVVTILHGYLTIVI